MPIVEWLKSLLLTTGAAPILYVMITLSIVSLGITLERLWVFRSKTGNLGELAKDLRAYLAEDDLAGARARMESSPSSEAAIVAEGLRHADRGVAAVDEAMAGARAVAKLELETRLSVLGTLGNNAPFIGLLGTVIGIVMAFERLGESPAGGRAAVPAEVMASIAEALVATAVGLAVAIPAVAAFNYFQRRIRVVEGNAEALTHMLLAHLSGDAR